MRQILCRTPSLLPLTDIHDRLSIFIELISLSNPRKSLYEIISINKYLVMGKRLHLSCFMKRLSDEMPCLLSDHPQSSERTHYFISE